MKIALLGRGRVGRSLAAALAAAGHEVVLLPGRDLEAALVGLRRSPARLVILALPDSALPEVAEGIARDALEPAVFAHTSGALGLAPVADLSAAGHQVGTFHPLQTFPEVLGPEAFAGITIAVLAGSAGVEALLNQVAESLGAVPRLVGEEERALYHAAAVMASNYIVALAGEAAGVLEAMGWDRAEATAALLPLMRGAVASLEQPGLPAALTGPVRRGDAAAVERHLAALGGLDHMTGSEAKATRAVGVYRMLGLAALELALEAGLDSETADRIRAALTA